MIDGGDTGKKAVGRRKRQVTPGVLDGMEIGRGVDTGVPVGKDSEGLDGIDGYLLLSNGNWYIGDFDTGVLQALTVLMDLSQKLVQTVIGGCGEDSGIPAQGKMVMMALMVARRKRWKNGKMV